MTATGGGSVGVVVLARLDSRRLPGKALRPLAGRPLMGRVLDRVRRVACASVVVATSDRGLDEPIAAFCAAEGVAVHRGSAEDVLGRLTGCVAAHDFAHAVRICGDSPFADPELIAAMLALHLREGAELTTNVFPRGFPPGASVEILTAAALERLDALARDPEQREHVTRACYDHPAQFRIHNVAPPHPFPATRLVVDDGRDLDRAEAVCRVLDRHPSATLLELAEAAARWDERNPA
ncbi:hypothetical protein A6A04_15805 [Paramagnetospirillum marisnigri]|uniref:Spore coat protein n=1 Tax=Paramagnetospirillum marisnigri TaxID=1285242 RepID=A0A178MSN8_9PROT|nr:NTP transferase domain-containing protein [Paramagnetospirillum marisnigri]OAN52761.1 hypothetical protein A6A04_15805 [Paramagnetospirillum marisnigri]